MISPSSRSQFLESDLVNAETAVRTGMVDIHASSASGEHHSHVSTTHKANSHAPNVSKSLPFGFNVLECL